MSLKDHTGREGGRIKMMFSGMHMIHYSIKVLLLYSCESQVLAAVTEMSTKTCGLAGSKE